MAKCKECGQPMLPKGAKKKPDEYDHAQGCPNDRNPGVPLDTWSETRRIVGCSCEWVSAVKCAEWLGIKRDCPCQCHVGREG